MLHAQEHPEQYDPNKPFDARDIAATYYVRAFSEAAGLPTNLAARLTDGAAREVARATLPRLRKELKKAGVFARPSYESAVAGTNRVVQEGLAAPIRDHNSLLFSGRIHLASDRVAPPTSRDTVQELARLSLAAPRDEEPLPTDPDGWKPSAPEPLDPDILRLVERVRQERQRS